MDSAELISLSAAILAVVLAMMATLWLVSIVRRDASLIDPVWGGGFVLIAILSYRSSSPGNSRAMLLTLLTTIWGLRLAGFLVWRNWGQGEDRRYTAMRDKHGKRFGLMSLVTVFLLQGLLMWFISWPVQFAQVLPATPLGWLDGLGVALWLVGMYFETVGDLQLARFRADAADAAGVLDRGLWRYTRHPNYFGDFCVWWGLYLVAASGGAWWTALSPLLMSFLLLRVSGVRLLESTIAERRPAYADYMRRTSAFFPRPPRSPR